MAEIKSRKKGCPFCGHLHIFEVICTEYGLDKDVQIPDSITMGRIPIIIQIVDSKGQLADDDLIQYCTENEDTRLFEKRHFFDEPRFMARSKGLPEDIPGIIDMFWKCKQCLRTWSPCSQKRFTKCPKCTMNSGIDIMYGMPSYIGFRSIERGEISSGGCVIDIMGPHWVCKECGHTWGGLQEEMDKQYHMSLIKDGRLS